MHADPVFDAPPRAPSRRGLEPFHDALDEVLGQWTRPVLLVHGDRHRFRLDRPRPDSPSLLRVETFATRVDRWLRVSVDPADPALFRVSVERVRVPPRHEGLR